MKHVDETVAASKEFSALIEMRIEGPCNENYSREFLNRLRNEGKKKKRVNLWHKAIVKNK